MSRARSAVDVFLVVPPGLDRGLFPWGVNSLADYVNHFGGATARVWALNEEPWLRDVAREYAPSLTAVLRSLSPSARGVFVGHTVSALLFLGVAGALGSRLLDIAESERLLRLPLRPKRRAALASELDEVQRHYRTFTTEGVRACVELSDSEGPGRRRVWGISVYDYTLFNSLALVGLIREVDPESVIVLGGDYFDYGTASTAIRAASGVDAVVVGYGEEVLRALVDAVARGEDVDGLEHAGLVTRSALRRADRVGQMRAADVALGHGTPSVAEREASVSIPPSYRASSESPPIDYVQVQENGVVRVLTQRGCSWGKCTFCSQLDRRLFFSLGQEAIAAQLEAALATTRADETRDVSLDADENDLNAVLPLLDVIDRAPGSYRVEFWLMVRKFGVELPRYLTAKRRNMKLTVILNVESLSQKTLKKMKKGVVPLAIIEAVKAIQDAGHTVRTNYFLNFPGEDVESVREEAEALERVVHLFTSDRMQPDIFTYIANTRDEIRWQSDKFAVVAGRVPEDVWNRRAHGVDLPFSIWTMKNERRFSASSARDLVPFTYHRMIFAQRSEILAEASQAVFGAEVTGRLDRALAALDRAPRRFWTAAHRVAQRVAKDDAYARRQRVFDHVVSVFDRDRSKAQQASRHLIDGSTLVREHHVPGAEGTSRAALSARELELLRFLYWRRKQAEVTTRFASWEPGVLDALLAKHRELGSIVTDGRAWLAVVNDPGYWETAAAKHEGPSALTDLEPRLPELAQLRPKKRRQVAETAA